MMLCNCKNFFEEDLTEGVLHKCKVCGKTGILSPETADSKPDTIREFQGESDEESSP